MSREKLEELRVTMNALTEALEGTTRVAAMEAGVTGNLRDVDALAAFLEADAAHHREVASIHGSLAMCDEIAASLLRGQAI